MARYTAEFLAALQYAYEETDEPLAALAARFGIGITTIGNLARKYNWKRRSQRMRACPPALDLLAQAQALASELRGAQATTVPLTPTLSPEGGGSNDAVPETPSPLTPTLSPHAGRGSTPALPALPGDDERATAIGRLEALVLKEIAAEESVRAELKARPRARGETEKNARALSILTQTWDALQHMRAGKPLPTGTPADDDDMPRDLDAFRDELARRIDAFVAARPDEADAALAERADADAAE